MKNNINFVNTPSPEKHQAVYRWYRTSIYATGTLCITLVAINAYQFYQLRTHKQLKKQLREITSENARATDRIKELAAIEQQLEKHARSLAAPAKFDPAAYVQVIARTIPDDTCLSTADLPKKGSMQLIGYTESAHSLKMFMQKLSESELFKTVELASLQPEKSESSTLYRFTMTAQLQSA